MTKGKKRQNLIYPLQCQIKETSLEYLNSENICQTLLHVQVNLTLA